MVASLTLPQPAAVGDEWGNALNSAVQAVNADVETTKGRTIAAGTGLLGGGSLAANRTLSVDFAASGTSSATQAVRADDVRLTDARTPLAHSHAYSSLTGIPATFAPSVHGHAQADVTNLVTDLAAKAPTARLISTGSGLTGGGSLAADRTLAVDLAAATPLGLAVAGAVGTATKPAREDHVHPIAATTVGVGAGAIVLGGNVASAGEGVNAYRATGTVVVVFYITTSAAIGADATVFTLPTGYRPPRIVRAGATSASGAWVPMYINTLGQVQVNLAQASGALIYGSFTFVVLT